MNRAELPPEVAGHVFGERLSALVCLLVGKYRLSKRLVQQVLSDLLGMSLSLGAISNREQEMSQALCAPVAEAQRYMREQDSVHMDETGWVEGHMRRGADGVRGCGWWRARWWPCFGLPPAEAARWPGNCSGRTGLVLILSREGVLPRGRRGGFPSGLPTLPRGPSPQEAAQYENHTREDFAGFLTTDRWSAYNWYDTDLRQLCWSHLTRDFQGFIDRGGEGARIGRALMKERNRMFKWWHRVLDGTMRRTRFEREMRQVQREVGRLLREAEARAEKKTAGMAREILKLEPAMWTFVYVEGVEPTNNFGERLIRHSVMYRKTSFGTQSSEGSRFVERILTAVTTLALQKRNVLNYLTELLRAHRRGLPAPSLLPATTIAQAASAA